MRAAVFLHMRQRRCLYHILDYVGHDSATTAIACPWPLKDADPSMVSKQAVLNDQYAQDDVSCIIPGRLYLSGLIGVRAKNLPVDRIISIGVCLSDFDKANHKNNMEYAAFQLEDMPDAPLLPVLKRVMQFLEERQDRPVLIHCQMGISRSASCVIAYLMRRFWRQTLGPLFECDRNNNSKMRKEFQWRLYHFCHNLVKSARNFIRPNKGFQFTLKNEIETLLD